jgi:hypothetical protein
MKTTNGIKTMDLGNGEFLHFWYANNRGRGTNNCTIIRTTAPRAYCSKKQENIIAIVKTSAWAGNVNFSKSVQVSLGV